MRESPESESPGTDVGRKRILGGLWGAVVGDALGVPVEFRSRYACQSDPVKDLREFGTHHQPKGTWSDDSSLMLCTVDSLLAHPFDTSDLAGKYLKWYQNGFWTARGTVFDVGCTTREALQRISRGAPADEAGSSTEESNGNGSLMRILPIALRFANAPAGRLIDYAHRASAITHAHPRSRMACAFYCLMTVELLRGSQTIPAYHAACAAFREAYANQPRFSHELKHFDPLLTGSVHNLPERKIESSGYVIDTLIASIWCLLNTNGYSQAVLKAVNLGEDTDTSGIVTGGLAGVCYGLEAVPEEWRKAMARADELETLFEQFVLCATQ